MLEAQYLLTLLMLVYLCNYLCNLTYSYFTTVARIASTYFTHVSYNVTYFTCVT